MPVTKFASSHVRTCPSCPAAPGERLAPTGGPRAQVTRHRDATAESLELAGVRTAVLPLGLPNRKERVQLMPASLATSHNATLSGAHGEGVILMRGVVLLLRSPRNT
jgi:hypothetical protein